MAQKNVVNVAKSGFCYSSVIQILKIIFRHLLHLVKVRKRLWWVLIDDVTVTYTTSLLTFKPNHDLSQTKSTSTKVLFLCLNLSTHRTVDS